MWVFSQHGFYSIVQHSNKKDMYIIRGRWFSDMENLKAVAGIKTLIIFDANTDYPYRMFVCSEELALVSKALFSTIDYPNFKNRIKSLDDQTFKSYTYTKIWSLLENLRRAWLDGFCKKDVKIPKKSIL
jgi:hypothetical protein